MLAAGQLRPLGSRRETEGTSNLIGARCLSPLRPPADVSYLVRFSQAPQLRRWCLALTELRTLGERQALGPSGGGRVEAGPAARQRKWKAAFLAQEEGKTYGSSPESTEAEKYLAKGFWVLRGWDAWPIDGVHPPSRRKCLQELGGGKIREGTQAL